MASNLSDKMMKLISFLEKYQHLLGGIDHTEFKGVMGDYIQGLDENGNMTGDGLVESLEYAGRVANSKTEDYKQIVENWKTSHKNVDGDLDAIHAVCKELNKNICVFDLTGDVVVRYFYNHHVCPNKIMHIVKIQPNNRMFVPLTSTTDISHRVVSNSLLSLIKLKIETPGQSVRVQDDVVILECRLDDFEKNMIETMNRHHITPLSENRKELIFTENRTAKLLKFYNDNEPLQVENGSNIYNTENDITDRIQQIEAEILKIQPEYNNLLANLRHPDIAMRQIIPFELDKIEQKLTKHNQEIDKLKHKLSLLNRDRSQTRTNSRKKSKSTYNNSTQKRNKQNENTNIINLDDYLAKNNPSPPTTPKPSPPTTPKPPPPATPKPPPPTTPKPSLNNTVAFEKARRFRQSLVRKRRTPISRDQNNNSNSETYELENYRNALSSHPGVKPPPKDPRVKTSNTPEPAFNMNQFQLLDEQGGPKPNSSKLSTPPPPYVPSLGASNKKAKSKSRFSLSTTASLIPGFRIPGFRKSTVNSAKKMSQTVPTVNREATWAYQYLNPPAYAEPGVYRAPFPTVTTNSKAKNTNPPPYVPPPGASNNNSKKAKSKSRLSWASVRGFLKPTVNSAKKSTQPAPTVNRPLTKTNTNQNGKKTNSPAKVVNTLIPAPYNARLKAEINAYEKFSKNKSNKSAARNESNRKMRNAYKKYEIMKANAQIARNMYAQERMELNSSAAIKRKQNETNAEIARLLQQNENNAATARSLQQIENNAELARSLQQIENNAR